MARHVPQLGQVGQTSLPEGIRTSPWLYLQSFHSSWAKCLVCALQVKLRCRKGIPSSLRAKAWQMLSNSKELLEANPGKFEVTISSSYRHIFEASGHQFTSHKHSGTSHKRVTSTSSHININNNNHTCGGGVRIMEQDEESAVFSLSGSEGGSL